jgi:hypothetical protein
MEFDNKYASKGVAGTGLGLGIAGTALGLLAGNGGINLLGNNNCGCGDGAMVNRYELSQSAKISELETEIKLRDSNIYTDGKILDLYKYIDGKISNVEGQICQQNVYNATNTATINCMAGQIAQLMSLTKTVIPNSSVCPGWGNVTVAPATTPTT